MAPIAPCQFGFFVLCSWGQNEHSVILGQREARRLHVNDTELFVGPSWRTS